MADPHQDFAVKNDGDRAIDLVLEPWGEIYPLAPGEQRTVRRQGDLSALVEITISANEIKVWENGRATSLEAL